jgi:hypothetical protein
LLPDGVIIPLFGVIIQAVAISTKPRSTAC